MLLTDRERPLSTRSRHSEICDALPVEVIRRSGDSCWQCMWWCWYFGNSSHRSHSKNVALAGDMGASMAVPDWMSYVGLAGGIVGTVSGCLAYRRTGQLKALDLRLELRKADSDLRSLVLPLPAHLDYAKRSRERLAAATGGIHSGSMQKWLTELESDLSQLRKIEAALPMADENYRSEKTPAIESKLVLRHQLMIEARALSTKYTTSVAQDDKGRDSIREALQNLREPR